MVSILFNCYILMTNAHTSFEIMRFNDSVDNSFIPIVVTFVGCCFVDGNSFRLHNYCCRCSRDIYVKSRKKCQQWVKLKRRHEWIGKGRNSFPHTRIRLSFHNRWHEKCIVYLLHSDMTLRHKKFTWRARSRNCEKWIINLQLVYETLRFNCFVI